VVELAGSGGLLGGSGVMEAVGGRLVMGYVPRIPLILHGSWQEKLVYCYIGICSIHANCV